MNYAIKKRGSNAAQVLEGAWGMLRGLIPNLPEVVIVVICAGARKRKYGHFARSSWRFRGETGAHEVGISPDLFAEPAETLGTMVHEAVHAQLYETTGSGGCRGPYYHLKTFRDACHNVGLECDFLNSRYGWTLTRWPESGIPERYLDVLNLLQRQLPLGTAITPRFRPPSGKVMPKGGHVRMACQCQPSRSIYMAQSVADEGHILCQFCQFAFIVADGCTTASHHHDANKTP